MTLGDRLMVLNAGYVEQYGSPIDVYENPASVFVAGFIGSPAMNLLKAYPISGGSTLKLENNAVIELGNGMTVDAECLFGVRPEHLIESGKWQNCHRSDDA